MAYVPSSPILGIQPINQTSNAAAPNHPLGTIVDAYDPTLGAGKFIYLYGVAANFVGALVTYNQLTGLTTLAPNTGNLDKPVAVSMSANTGTTSGSWYQIQGAAVIKKTAVKVSPSVPLYLSGTTGRVMSTAASGKQLLNMTSINAATVLSATSTITAQMNYPFAQGAIA